MDALTHGYGSSSDDDNEVSSTTKNDKNDDKFEATSSATASALHLLASKYSDDESDDNIQSSTFSSVNRNSKNKQNANENDMIPPFKKQKPDQNDNTDTKMQSQLPKPRLYNPQIHNPFESLVLFPKDYVSTLLKEKQQQNQPNTNNRNIRLETKLNNLYHQFNTIPNSKNDNPNNHTSTLSSSFATHLKNQKEFGNPHLFPSIIEHFGIDPLGSNCVMKLYYTDNDKKNKENDNNENDTHGNKNGQTKTKNVSSSSSLLFAKFEYVENIVQKEEENRIRKYNNNNTES